MRKLNCLRCKTVMKFARQEKIQLGQTGILLGDWPNIMAGALEVEIWLCPKCSKVEFFLPGYPEETPVEPEMDDAAVPPEEAMDIVGVSMEGIPQVRCPACGLEHDFDYHHCPRCEYAY